MENNLKEAVVNESKLKLKIEELEVKFQELDTSDDNSDYQSSQSKKFLKKNLSEKIPRTT